MTKRQAKRIVELTMASRLFHTRVSEPLYHPDHPKSILDEGDLEKIDEMQEQIAEKLKNGDPVFLEANEIVEYVLTNY